MHHDISKLSTIELEDYIDARYEAGAAQDELDVLETIYSFRVSEDDLNMSEDDPDIREAHEMGIDLEEWLAKEYFEYTHPRERVGGRESRHYLTRNCFDEFLTLHHKSNVRRKDIMAAAKDVYEYKRNLIQRYRAKNKFCNIPASLWPGK